MTSRLELSFPKDEKKTELPIVIATPITSTPVPKKRIPSLTPFAETIPHRHSDGATLQFGKKSTIFRIFFSLEDFLARKCPNKGYFGGLTNNDGLVNRAIEALKKTLDYYRYTKLSSKQKNDVQTRLVQALAMGSINDADSLFTHLCSLSIEDISVRIEIALSEAHPNLLKSSKNVGLKSSLETKDLSALPDLPVAHATPVTGQTTIKPVIPNTMASFPLPFLPKEKGTAQRLVFSITQFLNSKGNYLTNFYKADNFYDRTQTALEKTLNYKTYQGLSKESKKDIQTKILQKLAIFNGSNLVSHFVNHFEKLTVRDISIRIQCALINEYPELLNSECEYKIDFTKPALTERAVAVQLTENAKEKEGKVRLPASLEGTSTEMSPTVLLTPLEGVVTAGAAAVSAGPAEVTVGPVSSPVEMEGHVRATGIPSVVPTSTVTSPAYITNLLSSQRPTALVDNKLLDSGREGQAPHSSVRDAGVESKEFTPIYPVIAPGGPLIAPSAGTLSPSAPVTSGPPISSGDLTSESAATAPTGIKPVTVTTTVKVTTRPSEQSSTSHSSARINQSVFKAASVKPTHREPIDEDKTTQTENYGVDFQGLIQYIEALPNPPVKQPLKKDGEKTALVLKM